jgi:hypothetical protein
VRGGGYNEVFRLGSRKHYAGLEEGQTACITGIERDAVGYREEKSADPYAQRYTGVPTLCLAQQY